MEAIREASISVTKWCDLYLMHEIAILDVCANIIGLVGYTIKICGCKGRVCGVFLRACVTDEAGRAFSMHLAVFLS